MLASGFTNAPVSRFLVFGIIASSIIASITDSKYLFYIQIQPHIWRYRQAWRLLVWQVCYTNSTEVLFAAMSFYHLRIIERLWGPRKFASFLLTIIPYTLLLPPLLLALILRPLTLNTLNHLPAGPSPILFALLAQYHAVIPHVYKYRISTTLSPSSSPSSRDTPSGVLLSDKTTTYVLAFQLALSQFPGSLIGAAVGWTVGYAWRAELLPFSAAKWRVPAWVVTGKSEGAGYEGLRRRLEGESEAAAAASGVEGRENAGEGRRRRTLGTQILDQFRGAF